ncbi:MAG: hypothetical protein ABI977_37510 [Acidobacteriota bacterium]
MKNRMNSFVATAIAMTVAAVFSITAIHNPAHAQDGPQPFSRAPHCTNGTASGTYGYQMKGQIIGVGPFLVNGLFTHNPNGTMDADVQLTVGDQSFPAPGTNGSFKTNDDCTGSGKFTVAALNLDVTYNFIATDGGDEIELLNTNPGVVLHGVGRRIAKAGKAPSCTTGTVIGTYGYRLDGSLPGVPLAAFAGTVSQLSGDGANGILTGSDTANFMGQYLPRTNQGTYKIGSNCRGTGSYTDSLGNKINYVFTAVDGGETLYLQGSDPGVAVSGVARRIR